MKPVLRYFGSKFKTAKRIIEFMPNKSVYCEPFGGSAGVLLNRPTVNTEIYNEIHPRIFNLMKVMQSYTERKELCMRISETMWSKDVWCDAFNCDDDNIEDALKVLIRSWMSFSPIGIFRENSGYRTGAYDLSDIQSGHQAIWKRLPERLEEVGNRMQGWQMYCDDAVSRIHETDRRYGPNVLYYVDPPYLHSTRVETQGYQAEMSLDDHMILLRALQNVKGAVVLSGYQNSMYQTVLDDWSYYEYSSYAASQQGSASRVEVLWTNFKVSVLYEQSDLISNNY